MTEIGKYPVMYQGELSNTQIQVEGANFSSRQLIDVTNERMSSINDWMHMSPVSGCPSPLPSPCLAHPINELEHGENLLPEDPTRTAAIIQMPKSALEDFGEDLDKSFEVIYILHRIMRHTHI
jgi:hypothetical protein